MESPLNTELDFFILLQGIVLLLCGVQAFLLRRLEPRHGWLWLGTACLLLALGDTLDLAGLLLPRGQHFLHLLRAFLLPGAFVCWLVWCAGIVRGDSGWRGFMVRRRWLVGVSKGAVLLSYCVHQWFSGLDDTSGELQVKLTGGCNLGLGLVFLGVMGWFHLLLYGELLDKIAYRMMLRWRLAWGVLGVLVVSVGWAGAEHEGRMRAQQMRVELLDRTRVAAAAIPLEKVRTLSWSEHDLGAPDYESLKLLMRAYAKANSNFRFAMLMGINAEGTRFLVDSEDTESEDYSPPGQLYEEADAQYLQEVYQKKEFVLGPISDRWGKWVTVSVPLRGSECDKGWVTMDFDVMAEDWDRALGRARLPALLLTFMVFSLLGGLALAFEQVRGSAAQAHALERQSRTLVEGSRNCVLMIDSTGRVIIVNGNGAERLGCQVDDIQGKPFVGLWPGRCRAKVNELFKRTMAGVPGEAELEYDKPDGRTVTLSMSTSPIAGEGGECTGLVCIAMDVTERKRVELELRASKEAAENAAKAKSEFLALMSHEIRTPLSGVISLLGLLQKQPLAHQERRYAELARDNAETLLQILDDLLDASKIEAGKLVIEAIPFHVAHTMGPVLEIMRVRAEGKGLSLTCNFSPDLPEVILGDPTRLRQVVANLLNNAVKFTRVGNVHVSFYCEPVPPEWVMLHVRVSDTGEGITKDAQDRLFRRFEQADSTTTRRFGGTGLGLSIVKGIAEMMGGSIVVDSTEGEGATFTFSALLSVGPTDAYTQNTIAVESVSNVPKSEVCLHLLYAEDNETNQFILQSHLMLLGHEVEFADNGKIALQMLSERHYDGVFMDTRMPVMDGLEAARQIRKAGGDALDPEIYIIALTANSTEADRDKSFAAGMNDYLTKPVHEGELRRALDRVIGYQRRRGVGLAMRQSDDGLQAVPGLSAEELLAMAGVGGDELGSEQAEIAASPAGQLSRATLRTITQQYLDDYPKRMRAMREALEREDSETLAITAHSLKSVSRYVNALEVAEQCAKLEALADAKQFSDARPLIDAVEHTISLELPRLEAEAVD